jgi:hypothetical protein
MIATFGSPAQKLAIAAVLAAALLGVSAVIVVNLLKPIPIEKSVGIAEVQAPSADLLEAPRSTSKRIMPITQGMPINILDRLADQKQPFIVA